MTKANRRKLSLPGTLMTLGRRMKSIRA